MMHKFKPTLLHSKAGDLYLLVTLGQFEASVQIPNGLKTYEAVEAFIKEKTPEIMKTLIAQQRAKDKKLTRKVEHDRKKKKHRKDVKRDNRGPDERASPTSNGSQGV